MKTLDELIAQATASGGSERANYQLFISGLCTALGLPAPLMSSEFNHQNDYVYERSLDCHPPETLQGDGLEGSTLSAAA